MKRTVCDVCGELASATYNVKELRLGLRPLLIFPAPEQPGKFLDLCPDHDVLAPLLKGGEVSC